MSYQKMLESFAHTVCISLNGQMLFRTYLDQNPPSLLTFADPDTGEVYEFDISDFEDALENEEDNLELIAQQVLQNNCEDSTLVIYNLEPTYIYKNGTIKSG